MTKSSQEVAESTAVVSEGHAQSGSSDEIRRGERFAFGENWSRFLEVLDEDRIREAQRSLQDMLGMQRLDGLSFLDVGSGSGLFSLAAWRLGARVRSFDYDPRSVATTREMRRRYGRDDESWVVEEGSVLDRAYLGGLGQFDIVYSWGVLHHTGSMWEAMANVAPLVAHCGRLFIALYNDQDLVSRFWGRVKRLYCSGWPGRMVVVPVFFAFFAGAGLVGDLLRHRNPVLRYSEYRRKRGMSLTHDWIDWLGGYPYETAKPGDVFDFFCGRGFTLRKLVTRASLGCNEFVFARESKPGCGGSPTAGRIVS
ncbi:2-polyprenyl-6-hydroxyphenyl methylase / 3-demethylubiquinone-9 3-methyltransferase [Aromatoleum tolulyticum]|uniref:2-polyprenyl-6-hydroxyphenyl methylase / 3-demethylubiquinone-9 3-methyltransferase n=1 Tax=Aromatoleum tolulyticum TaxID=34027 RepID=A0A1N6ZNB4_9RHOO|nr:methyltransferase domain-containing protein [Aromatoleum tolulyticum]SIR28362.1 2-polyprenyl-6-hydroxyphenyl methylase / 3-demethylubiquinone-9 3-methyltransferase [Aromatoleum tolulyticum]